MEEASVSEKGKRDRGTTLGRPGFAHLAKDGHHLLQCTGISWIATENKDPSFSPEEKSE